MIFRPFEVIRRKRPRGKNGTLRRRLERLAPTWAASPWRRAVQSLCLAVFVVSFFYVLWPYGARPAPIWNGLLPSVVDSVSGCITLAADPPLCPKPAVGTNLFFADAGSSPPASLGEFRVLEADERQLLVEPASPLSTEAWDRLSTSFGPWTMSSQAPDHWPSHYADDLAARQWGSASLLLALDPLVSLSAGIAARGWVWSLAGAAVVMLACLVVPRAFCGYVCPLGTVIDLFDATLGRMFRRLHGKGGRRWAGLKYAVLACVLAGSLLGMMLAGYVAPIPVLTRGMALLVAPVQTGILRGWHQVPPMGPGQYFSIGLFLVVPALGALGPRFWCRCLCPSGAMFSLMSAMRLHQRHVQGECTACGRCAALCPFDAVNEDCTTRTSECAMCLTCAGTCPMEAVTFAPRWKAFPRALETAKEEDSDALKPRSSLDRRGFLSAGARYAAGGAAGISLAFWTGGSDSADDGPVRPPGSVPEAEFLARCVRCGQCLRTCPNDALQFCGGESGLHALWTPSLAADWAGCEPSCNRCGQVCPTGAIRDLSLEEKRSVRMGLAVVDTQLCLPHAQREECRRCVDECLRTGYNAMEFVRVGTQTDAAGQPIPDTGFLAPVVLAEKCVGCGCCQASCHAENVRQKALLPCAAVRMETGPGREDRR